MSKRKLAALLASALVALPATAASAQEGEVVETTTEATESGEVAGDEVEAAATPTSLLAALVALLQEAAADAVEILEDGEIAADDTAAPVDEVVDETAVDETVVDETVVEDFEEAPDLRTVLANFLAAIVIEAEVAEALAEVEGDVEDGLALVVEDDTAVDGDEASEEAEDVSHGEVVRTVAACAPRGKVAKGLIPGVKNHGQLVRLAAHGETVRVAGVDPDSGDEVSESFDLATQEGADGFCFLLDLVVTADQLLDDADQDDVTDGEEAAANEDESKGKSAEKSERKADKPAKDKPAKSEKGKNGKGRSAKG